MKRPRFAGCSAVLAACALAAWAGAATAAGAGFSPGRGSSNASTPAEILRPSRTWAPDGEETSGEAPVAPVPRCHIILAEPHARLAGETALAPGGEAYRPLAQQAFESLARELGVSLRARWNARTGLPHRAWGAGLRVEGAPFSTAPEAEAAARAFVARQASLLTGGETPAPEDMPLVKATRVRSTWFLVFGQRQNGLEVLDGRVDVRLTVDGDLVAFGSDWYPGVTVAERPLVHRSAAEAVARAGVGFVADRDETVAADLTILPVADGAGVGFRLVHRILQRVADPPGLWLTLVDAENGRVWARENQVRSAVAASGQVTGDILPSTYTDGFSRRPFFHEQVTRGDDTTHADTAGSFRIPGRAPRDSIHTLLRSPFLRVLNFGGPSAAAAFRSPPPSRELDVVWQADNSDTVERNAYYHAHVAHDAIRRLDPSFTALDYVMPCRVNLSGACNAFWDGRGINFMGYGAGCANTATMADVIYHEYGHGITQETFAPFLPSAAMNEGFSDYWAASIRGRPEIGPGFFGPGTSVRTVENQAQIRDPACAGEPHCTGQGVSGALWDLRSRLVVLEGEAAGRDGADSLWHFAGYGGAFWYDDYLLDLLVVDDDDGSLVDGTPRYDHICQTFEAHGFHCPERASAVWIDHEPLADADPSPLSYPVVARMGSPVAPLAPGAQRLHYRVNGGGWVDEPLGNGGGNLFQGVLPALPVGGRIDYYLENRDQSGASVTSPAGAPERSHNFYVGTLRTVFADDFEYDRYWVPNVGNTASAGFWVRVEPFGHRILALQTQPENDHTLEGHVCWVTGDTLAETPGDDDIDNGCVYLVSPPLDLSGLANARLSYWRWFANEIQYDDSMWVDVSDDDGVTWKNLEVQTFTQNFWRERSFDLGSVIHLTDRVRMRIYACDTCLPSITEAALDDVLLTTRDYDASPGRPRPLAEAASRTPEERNGVSPSPGRGPYALRFEVPGASGGAFMDVSVSVYDSRGRLTRSLVSGRLAPGPYRAVWDGADAAGRRVPAGVYLARFRAGPVSTTWKLVRTE